ncbi:MAG: PilN domain-containing protein [Gammaproteobacteria bacterium]|nr:PilN domain-containing protein [Gammaproteobacteria bacterium]
MVEIDLIPEAYRKRLLFTRWIKQALLSLALLSSLIIVAFFYLRSATVQIDLQLKQLQSQKAISSQQRSELEKLTARKKDLTQQLALLAGLRSGSAAEQMFLTVDKALTAGDVWFTNWKFRRAGTATDKAPKEVNTGYFVVIQAGAAETEEAWKIETHMAIQGQALDHAALSGFVSSLIDQPTIQHVRVVRTEQVNINNHKLVNFSLDILVADGAYEVDG